MTSATPDTSVGSTFRVRLLGPFALERDGEALDTARWQRRVASLFKLLVLAPDQRRLRDEVIDIFWPEADVSAAAVSLRVTAHRLRLSLGGGEPSPVLIEGGWVALNPTCVWDVDAQTYERQAREAGEDLAALEEALALWSGEPLPDERYEDWAMPIRDQLVRLWRDLSLRLAQTAVNGQLYPRAEDCLNGVLNADPLDEEALRRLLDALYRAGRRTEALRRYQQFEKRLGEELGVPPSVETMAAVQRLSAEFPQPPSRPPLDVRSQPLAIGRVLGTLPEGRMIDRIEELDRILLAAARTESGSGRAVMIGGDRGVGKTRLAQEVAIRLRDGGFVVGTGRCARGSDAYPFAPFADALAFLPEAGWGDAHLAAILHGSVAGETVPRRQMIALLTDALGIAAERQPVALVLDDLHQADEGTLDLLRRCVELAGARRLLIVGTFRDDMTGGDHPLSRVTQSLEREGLLERLTLRRLSMEDTAELVDVLIGDLEAPAEFTEFVYRRTRGNPFFIDRMLQALGERYSLTRQIGMGGMGRVFEAIDGASGDLVAVKIMFARSEADPRALRRFEQEGAILATLHHPNIVTVYGTHLDEFTNAIVMELLGGVPLSVHLQGGLLPLPRTRHVGSQVIAALDCAHRHRIVHRDIKPGNIMVLDDDTVKVTDFGIARLVRPPGSLTTSASTGLTTGTPLYMAPEQIEGQRIDGRADIYSLGVVLYQAVTGQLPFTGDDALAIAFKHVHDAPAPPGEMCPDIPDDWEALILKALAKSPADRFQSAAEMGEALRTLSVEPRTTKLVAVASVGRPLSQATASASPQESAPFEIAGGQTSTAIADQQTNIQGRKRTSRLAWAGAAAAVTLLAGTAVFAIMRNQQGSPKIAVPPSVTLTKPKTTPVRTEAAKGTRHGQFDNPTGITLDSQGNVYAVDSNNERVQEFSSNRKWLRQFPASGRPGVRLNSPTNAAIAPNGSVFVTDYNNARIVVFAPNGTYKRSIYLRLPRDHSPQHFSNLALDRQGNIYGTNLTNNQVVKLSPQGKWLEHWGRHRFHGPESVAIAPDGNVYVSDTYNNRVLEYSVSGRYPKLLRAIGRGQLDEPEGIAMDKNGTLYVADWGNDRIAVFSASGRYLGHVGQHGTARGQMLRPTGVAVDRQGDVYVADNINNRIEKFSPQGRLIWETPNG